MATCTLALLLPSKRNRRHMFQYVLLAERTQAGWWVRSDEGELPYAVPPEEVVVLAEGNWGDQRPREIMESLPTWGQCAIQRLTEELMRLYDAKGDLE